MTNSQWLTAKPPTMAKMMTSRTSTQSRAIRLSFRAPDGRRYSPFREFANEETSCKREQGGAMATRGSGYGGQTRSGTRLVWFPARHDYTSETKPFFLTSEVLVFGLYI